MYARLDCACVVDRLMIEIIADSVNPAPDGLPTNRMVPFRMAGIVLVWAEAGRVYPRLSNLVARVCCSPNSVKGTELLRKDYT